MKQQHNVVWLQRLQDMVRSKTFVRLRPAQLASTADLSDPKDCMPMPPTQNPMRGILWMLLVMMMFASMDATAKYLTQYYPVAEVVWARYTIHVLLLILLLNRRIPKLMVTQHLYLQLVRSLLLFLTTGLFFTGLSYLALVDASVIMFMSPLFVTAMAAPLLGEHVGVRRWVGVFVGFLGALVVIRPGIGSVHWAAVFPLTAAGSYALYQVATRRLGHADSALTTLCYSALFGAVVMSLVVPFVFVMPDLADAGLMLLLGMIGGLGHFALIKSLQSAPVSVVAPFGYTSLIWSTSYGYLLFADLPDRWTLTGAFIIVSSGLYVWYRERLHTHSATP